MATSRAAVLRDVCEMLHAAQEIMPIGSTSALGSTTTLVDGQNLLFSSADANQLDGIWARIDALVTNGPASGSWSRIIAAGLAPASGTVTVSPAFSNAVQNGTNYSLWRLIHPKIAEDLLNIFLINTKVPAYSPVSLFADADMEAAGTSSYTATTATLTKDTTAAEVRHGAQSLKIAGNGGAPTAETTPAVNVIPSDLYICSSTGMVLTSTGTLTLSIWDNTNGVEIANASHSNQTWMELNAVRLIAIPSTCRSVTFRLKGDAVGTTVLVDDVILWPWSRLEYLLDASAWQDPSDIIDIGYFEAGEARGGGVQAHMVDNRSFVPIRWTWDAPANIDETAANPFRLRFQQYNNRPLYIFGHKPYASLSSDTATTTCDKRFAVLGTMWLIFDYLLKAAQTSGDPTAAQWGAARDAIGRDAYYRANLTRFKHNRMRVRGPVWGGYGAGYGH